MSTARTDRPHPFRLALAAPVFAAPGYPAMRTPSLETASWDAVHDLTLRAEELGYDSVWFSDHLFHGRDGAFFESWTAMSIAAGFTRRIRLVDNHLGNGLRDARVVAKMATTLAAATDGRLDLFLAKGYREREYRAYGLAWEPDETRLRRLSEAVDVIRALWPGGSTDFDGEYYQLKGALAAPSTPTPPFVWLGGPLDDATCALIAEKADGWNSGPLPVEDYCAASARVDEACARIGRDPSTLRRSLETQVLVLDDDAEWQWWLDRWRRLRDESPLGGSVSDLIPPPEDLDDARVTAQCREHFIVGTRSVIASRISDYRAAGVTDLVCWFMDAPADRSLMALHELVQTK